MPPAPDREERARLFEQLTRSTSEAVWMFAADWSEVLFVTPTYEELWGRSVEALEDDPRDFLAGVHPADRDAVREALARLSAGEEVDVEVRVNPTEDYARWVWIEGRPVFDDGEVVRVAGFTRDVTQRKRYEHRLEALNDATRELMVSRTRREVGETAVAIADDALDRTLAAVWWYRGSEGELVPLAASDRASAGNSRATQSPNGSDGSDGSNHSAHPVGAIPADTAEMDVFLGGEPVVFDDYGAVSDLAHPDAPLGSVFLVPLGDFGMLAVGDREVAPFEPWTRDLIEILAQTVRASFERVERRRALHEHQVALERQNDRLEQFTSVVSHDLRNPLAVAKARVDMARQEGDSDHLTAAATALERMDALVDDTLALARLGDTIEDRETIALESLARESWENVATGESTLAFREEPLVDGDPGRLRRVFENLFRNAVEHADGAVTVRVGRLPEADGFFVADDGPGIDPADRERVFDTGFTTDGPGTGLGLSIVRRIVDAHGWEVTATRSAAEGARFEVRGADAGVLVETLGHDGVEPQGTDTADSPDPGGTDVEQGETVDADGAAR